MKQLQAIASKFYDEMRSHHVFAKYPAAKQFAKFVMVGLVNTAIDFFIYFSLTRGTDFFERHLLSANIIAFSIAATNSFFWNKKWTFRDQGKNYHVQYSKFLIVSIGGLLLSQGIFVLGVHYLKISDIITKLAAVAIVTFWNFALNKLWTFKNK